MTSSFSKPSDKNHGTRPAGRLLKIFPAIILLTTLLMACTEDPTRIGLTLLPGSDFVELKSTDTITVRAYTMYNDQSLTTDSTRMLAGTIHDDYFGTTHCDFVTQLRLMSPWTSKSFVVDSVLLTFLPAKITGDTSTVQYLRLYETGTLLTDSTDFFSAQDPDTIKFLGEYRLPDMKAGAMTTIKLQRWVGEYLLRDTAMFRPPAKFYNEFFKGLYFGIRSEDEPILIELNASRTATIDPLALTVFYRSDTLRYNYSFVATHRAVNYNRFTHDRSTADPDKQIKHVNDMVPDTAVFMQSYQGVYVKLDFPSLRDFRNVQNLSVNKARIIAPVLTDGDLYVAKNMPAQVYARYRRSDGREVLVPDILIDVSFMDGTYKSEENCYVFNITSFVQRYLAGKIDEPSVELFLPLSAARNVIFRANSNNPTFKLEFAYTIF